MQFYPLLLIVLIVADVAYGYSEEQLIQFLGDHGDRLYLLEQTVGKLKNESYDLSSEVTSLRAENQQLVDKLQILTNQCTCCQTCAVNASSTSGQGNIPVTKSSPSPTLTPNTASITHVPTTLAPATNASASLQSMTHTVTSQTMTSTMTSQVTSSAASTPQPPVNTSGPVTPGVPITPGSTIQQPNTTSAIPLPTDTIAPTTTEATTPTPPTMPPTSTQPTTQTTTTQPTTQTPTTPTTPAPTRPVWTTPAFPPAYDDCEQAIQDGQAPGLVNVSVGIGESASVNCEISQGLAYLVIQRRIDGSVDFNRNWDSYKNGFGDLNAEFWLGNEYIHKLTNRNDYTLRIDFVDWAQNHRYAEYQHFSVASEINNYRLTAGSYSGTAGDSFHYHESMMLQHYQMSFSTPDRDNDHSSMNCAKELTSGWWFNNCYSSNLNGPYLPSAYGHRNLGEISGQPTIDATGVEWYPYRHRQYSMKRVEMKLRLTRGSLVG